MSILMITLNDEAQTETDDGSLISALTELYAASLGCSPSGVNAFVEYQLDDDKLSSPNVEFLVPSDTPLADDPAAVDKLKRRFEKLIQMWPHAAEMLEAVNER